MASKQRGKEVGSPEDAVMLVEQFNQRHVQRVILASFFE